jgi:photosystem II stability/assembly factor-like uncharacterized protein
VPGIYKSTNGGETWKLASRGLFGLPTASLAFDPNVPGAVWAGSSTSGVFRSGDGGITWQIRNGDLPGFLEVHAVEVDPLHSGTVWIGTSIGVYVTEDGGATWEERNEGLVPPGSTSFLIPRLRIAATDPAIAYAPAFRDLYRTTDGGEHWTRFGVPFTFPFSRITDLLIDPRDPEALFVASGEIYASRDGGATWGYVPVADTALQIEAIARDPRNPDVLHAGGESGLFRSTDAGGTWQRVTAFPASGVSKLAVGPTGTVWAATDAGIWMGSGEGSSWAPAPGMEPFSVHDIEVDPHHPETAFAATGAGIFRHGS